MSQYLLSTFAAKGDATGAQPTPEEMKAFMERVVALEADMDANGAFVFGGALSGPDGSKVFKPVSSDVVMTDGPFVETKEHIAGFYIINADDLDEASEWGRKVAGAIMRPIEVRPFAASGRVADQMPGD